MAQSSTSPPSGWKEKYQEAKKLQDRIQTLTAEKDAYYWLTECTKTQDEQDSRNPYKPFPKRRYLKHVIDVLQHEPIVYIYKSRTMLGSWTCSGVAAHYAFNNPATGVVFMSQDHDRALHDRNNVATLWSNSSDSLRAKWELKKPLEKMAFDRLDVANGSWFLAIPGDPNKIRSQHPTIILLDEAAFIEKGEESFNTAIATRCPKMWILSSANSGWMDEIYKSCVPADWPDYENGGTLGRQPCPGLKMMRTPEGHPFVILHYSADETLTKDKIAVLRAKYSSQAYWDREMEIQADALSGELVYAGFDENVHVVPDSAVPKELCRYCSIDPHPRTPHAVLWIGIDKWNDWWVYREIWPSRVYGVNKRLRDDDKEHRFTIREYAEIIAYLEGNRLEWESAETQDERAEYIERPGGERVIRRFMDQAGKAFRASGEGQALETYAQRYRKFGLVCADPKKSHNVGEDAIRELLTPRFHDLKGNWPRLHIAESNRELILEFKTHRYKITKTVSEERDLKEDASDARTHMLDNLRYLATARLYFDARYAS